VLTIQNLFIIRLVYRDIKPENLGIDIRGDVKVFDFGLTKSLDRKHKVKNGYGYKLTGKTGSIPYMAPEVAMGKPYDREADVFSFAILLWEIMSLKWAFNGYSRTDYFRKVVKHNERLPVKSKWPAMIRTIIMEAWDKDPQRRPTMKRVGALIRGFLGDIATDDEAIINRTQHMMNRSRRSMHAKGTPSMEKRSISRKSSH
jgi:serine/threonine protein kinase